jgi:hypothetical protein
VDCNRRSHKKLEEAGEWLGTPADDKPSQHLARLDAELEDAVFMGYNRESYKASQHERDSIKGFELFEENLEAFNFFNELSTQRNYAAGPSGPILIGLNYTGIMSYLRSRFSRKKSGYILDDLKAIEQGFVRAANDKTKTGVSS